MADYIGHGRKARRAFGFDEVAIVPGRVTINPEEVDTAWELRDLKFPVPILAAAMDGVVDTATPRRSWTRSRARGPTQRRSSCRSSTRRRSRKA